MYLRNFKFQRFYIKLRSSFTFFIFQLMTFQLKNLDSFIDDNKGRLEQRDFDKSYKIWSGFYIVAQLENLGLGPKFFPDLKVQSHDLLLILIL